MRLMASLLPSGGKPACWTTSAWSIWLTATRRPASLGLWGWTVSVDPTSGCGWCWRGLPSSWSAPVSAACSVDSASVSWTVSAAAVVVTRDTLLLILESENWNLTGKIKVKGSILEKPWQKSGLLKWTNRDTLMSKKGRKLENLGSKYESRIFAKVF